MSDRTKPKFKIGQIVIMKSLKKPPFRILGMRWYDDEWYYQWNRNNFATEFMIRELTPAEKGE
jgi:hypothetical protein